MTAPSCHPRPRYPRTRTGKDEPEEIRSIGRLIDDALEPRANEKKLKNVLDKNFARTQIEAASWPT